MLLKLRLSSYVCVVIAILREDEIGCTGFAPVDAFDSPATGTPKEA